MQLTRSIGTKDNNAAKDKSIARYLERYAEPEHRQTTENKPMLHRLGTVQNILALPCYAENIENLHRFTSFLRAHKNTLLILVLNQPDSLSPEETDVARARNQSWLDYLSSQGLAFFTQGQFYCYQIDQSFVLCLDRFRDKPIPRKQGVGLARKIAADIALSLAHNGIVATDYIYSTDADCTLPDDYFTAAKKQRGDIPAAAKVLPFQHVDQCGKAVSMASPDAISAATALYEERLKGYCHGLARAGSPYAYHSMGSCLCINMNAYAKVRGFPRRSAGEDFYILNKLRKLGSIETGSCSPIKITARVSQRAPFGTGSAVADMLADIGRDDFVEPSAIIEHSAGNEPSANEEHSACIKPSANKDSLAHGESDTRKTLLAAKIYYPSEVFDALGVFLLWQAELAQNPANQVDDWRHSLAKHCKRTHSGFLLRGISADDIVTATANIKFDEAISHLRSQHLDNEKAAFHLFCWFDAFKTLRWIHALQASAQMGFRTLAETRVHRQLNQ